MEIKYGISIENAVIYQRLKKMINQVYKLLPMREEKENWEKALAAIMEELAGMSELLRIAQEKFFSLLCKLEGLYTLNKEEDFDFFRKTIFDCCTLIEELKKDVCG